MWRHFSDLLAFQGFGVRRPHSHSPFIIIRGTKLWYWSSLPFCHQGQGQGLPVCLPSVASRVFPAPIHSLIESTARWTVSNDIFPGQFESSFFKKHLVIKSMDGKSIMDLDILDAYRTFIQACSLEPWKLRPPKRVATLVFCQQRLRLHPTYNAQQIQRCCVLLGP